MELTLKGRLTMGGCFYEDLCLEQDKEEVDPLPISDLLKGFNNKKVKLRYGIKNTPFDCIDTELCNVLFGIFETDDESFRISEYTNGIYYYNTINGHNFHEIFKSFLNKYIVLEIKEIDIPEEYIVKATNY